MVILLYSYLMIDISGKITAFYYYTSKKVGLSILILKVDGKRLIFACKI